MKNAKKREQYLDEHDVEPYLHILHHMFKAVVLRFSLPEKERSGVLKIDIPRFEKYL